MKKPAYLVIRPLFLGLAILLSHCLVAGAEEPSSSKIVRVAFWNLEWFPGKRPKATTTEVVDQIVKIVPAVEKLDADIIGFTEVQNAKAMTIALYKSLGRTPQVCSEFLDEEGKVTLQQIGIASKMAAMSAWWENWKQAPVTPKRGFSFAAFEPSPGNILLVYTVHLKSNRGDLVEDIAMREESAKQLLTHVKEMEKAYSKLGKVAVVIGGDFNTSLDDPKFQEEKTLRLLQKAGFDWCWTGVPFEKRITLPGGPAHNPKLPPFPDTCFDHVFTKGVKLASASVAEGEMPSDHRAVIVDLAIPASSPDGEQKEQ